ncbi:cytochrome P450 [Mycena maculata]|uniref:Cytochrome P450 n=1 Tax=Mycena maculata TaxID=230809 RepID=A0AAD7JN59_9AGAR|nr:cytochrome P450 [Mycena maculata]
MRPLLHPLGLGALFPTSWWNPGLFWIWEWRRTSFFHQTHDVISMVPLLVGAPCYYTSSPDVMKQLLNNELKTYSMKPNWLTSTLLLWGDNLFSANGDMWKRHRRILAPAFTAKTYTLVASETAAACEEMIIAEGWDAMDSMVIEDFNRLPLKLGLMIIARCGFGLRLPWKSEPNGEHGLDLEYALRYVARTRYARVRLPPWIYKLRLQRVDAFDRVWKTLDSFMHEFLRARQTELVATPGEDGQSGDIFSRLVAAMDSEGRLGLDEQEMIGNAFMLMFGGHETTAAALATTMGFLAIHQQEQETAYSEIVNTIPPTRDPAPNDFSKMPHLLACFHESLRIFPAAMLITREMTEDVPIKVRSPAEEIMVLKKGSLMIIEMIAVHRNPRFFPDPEKYRPSRWYGVADPDLSMFGVGPRACIGKRFGQTMAISFLTFLLRDWKVDVTLLPGESRAEYEQRVMGKARRVGFAFGCESLSLKFTRRK